MSFLVVMEGSDVLENQQKYLPELWDTMEEDSTVYEWIKVLEHEFKQFYECLKDVMNSHFIAVPLEAPIDEPENITKDSEHQLVHRISGIALRGFRDEDGNFKDGIGGLLGFRIGEMIEEPEDLYRSRLLGGVVTAIQGGGSIPSIETMMKLATRRLNDEGAHPEGYNPEVIEDFSSNQFRWGDDSSPPSEYSYWFYWGDGINIPPGNVWFGDHTMWSAGEDTTEKGSFIVKFNLDSLIENIEKEHFNMIANELVGNLEASTILMFSSEDLDGEYRDLSEVATDENIFSFMKHFDYIVEETQFKIWSITQMARPNEYGTITPTANLIIGKDEKFDKIAFKFKTAASSQAGYSIKYWNGETWASVTGLNDGTIGFTQDGVISFNMPENWELCDDTGEPITFVVRPNGQGTVEWTPYPSAPNWERVNDISSQPSGEGDGEYIYTIASVGRTDTYNMETNTLPSGYFIRGVRLWIYWRDTSGEYILMAADCNIGGWAGWQYLDYLDEWFWDTVTWWKKGDQTAFDNLQLKVTVNGEDPPPTPEIEVIYAEVYAYPMNGDKPRYLLKIEGIDQSCEITTIMPCDDTSGNAESYILIGADKQQTGFGNVEGGCPNDSLSNEIVFSADKYPQIVKGLTTNWVSKKDSSDSSHKLIGSSKLLDNTKPFERTGKDIFPITFWEDQQKLTIKGHEKYWLLLELSYTIYGGSGTEGFFLFQHFHSLVQGTTPNPILEKFYKQGETYCQHLEYPIEKNTLQYEYEMIPDDDTGQLDLSGEITEFPDGSTIPALKTTVEGISPKNPHSGVRLNPYPYDLDNGGINEEVTNKTIFRSTFYLNKVSGNDTDYVVAIGIEFNNPDDLSQMKYQLLYALYGNVSILDGYTPAPYNGVIDLTDLHDEDFRYRISRNLYEDFEHEFDITPPSIRKPIPLIILIKNGTTPEIEYYTTNVQLFDVDFLNDFDYWTQPSNMSFLFNLLKKIKAGGMQASLLFTTQES